jgi:aminoglycoside phosphotransferase (APT) family kinase protein
MEDVQERPEDALRAAKNLGRWQATSSLPDLPWLARNQLSDRVHARDDLDWSTIDADTRAAEVWGSRYRLLSMLGDVHHVISHGDFSIGNLRYGDGATVALDWATVGNAPLGADCATLALSTEADVLPAYLAGLGSAFPPGEVLIGYYVTLALTGASRVHWMRGCGMPVAEAYVERVWDAYVHCYA